jgi:hypothetical protein
VRLNFNGQGQRHVNVGYLLETPIWKTSYRLDLPEKKPPFLQGWAIVENTTDDDWDAVALTLVSGRPISFIMDLYQPLYVPRPTVVPEIYASLRAPVYESPVAEKAAGLAESEAPMAPTGMPAKRSRANFGGAAMNTPLPAAAAMEPAEAHVMTLSDAGITSMAAAGAVGELFQYAIDQPVTIARQKSALLPIVNSAVQAEKLSIYNQSVQPKFPLNGLRLKNTTPLHLMQGPITVFESGVYAGDARIEDLQPHEERLISYALDLKVEVEPVAQSAGNDITALHVRKGLLVLSHRLLETKAYNIRNKAAEKRTVLIEHPFRADWKLLEPPQPAERTPSVYRFQVQVEAGKGEKLLVNEERLTSETIALLNADIDTLLLHSRNHAISSKVKQALEKVVSMRTALADVQRHSAQVSQQINDITQEQNRIRDNMKVLAQNSDLYSRYVKKFDEQETQIESLRTQLTQLRADEATQRKQLDDYLNGLELE